MNSACCLLFLTACYFISYSNCLAGGTHESIHCIHDEREALLQFKQGIQFDRCGLLSSWQEQASQHHLECCQWEGVHCNNHTGHVTMLALRGVAGDQPCLEGTVSTSLLKLKHLKYLDLSLNDFGGEPVPSFIGSFTNLQHLNLSKAGFSGEIPHQLGNLFNLASLDLSCDFGNSYGCPYADSLKWLSHLTLLRDISLSGIDLSQTSDDWYQVANNLTSLSVLHMERCGLSPSILNSISYMNSSSSFSVIDLSNNNFNDTSIFKWLFNLKGIGSTLVHLDLSDNQIPGPIPHNFGKMLSLSYLDLSSNLLQGPIPSAFWNMRSISYLSLAKNQLEGPIPDTISNLKHLSHLILSGNAFQGRRNFPKSLGSLCNLQDIRFNDNNLDDELSTIIQALSGCVRKSLVSLELSQNRIWGSIPDIISTFSLLDGLILNTNRLNGTISPGIGQLQMLEILDLSYNSLKDTISHNHLSNLSRLSILDLSNNPDLVVHISPDWVPPFQLTSLILESCKLGPSFPKWLVTQTNLSYIGISNAGISDTIPTSFWNSLSPSNLVYLNMSYNMISGVLPNLSVTLLKLPIVDLSSNILSGAIPSFLRNATKLYLNNNRFSDLSPFFCPKQKTSLTFLNLANNLFSGEIPDCWMYFDQLLVLHLENNNFSRKLPASIGALTLLYTLHLRNNSLSGELPKSLQNCTSLVILDLGYNTLTGKIPQTIGHSFENLRVLSLQSNNFVGELPLSLCQLSQLQILDVSINHISGILPKCLYNLTAMTGTEDGLPDLYVDNVYNYYVYSEYARLMWKRKEQRFQRSMGQVIAIDISDNELEGHIPEGISSLTGLIFLNLSRNHLSGNIASKVGQLVSLEFLDLSNNHLSGEIPTTLSEVASLEILDLSNNNLSGKIPVGTQLQSFDSSSYMGNPGLCGLPLPKCSGDQPPANNVQEDDAFSEQNEDDSSDILLGLLISVLLGFIIGFWGVFGTLVIKTAWRLALFKFFDDMKEKLYALMVVIVNIAKVWRT
ncbi:receptor-like protein EIX2 isoform X1 [Spinacia oleracea]|uniref:Receptor-like protein EIX2 isoform X1 n=2 Tax=Spinacia oleracea TaxID=3562 RepID=A0A9R0HZ54_SPIOL|nr:receptor-like protein EIX2 isoform X1 [Spinacia oleracea]